MKIDCVSISTIHHFPGNLVSEQHQLRYREVIVKEGWGDVYVMGHNEFDKYDNIATEYFVARDEQGKVVGVVRTYPTTIPSMLNETFNFLSTRSLPADPKVLDCSRMVLDRTALTREKRKPVVNALVLAVQERGLQRELRGYVGFMLPKIWASTFVGAGWQMEWLDEEKALPKSGDVVRAAFMPVSEAVRNNIRSVTGITGEILNFGKGSPLPLPIAFHSHMEPSR
jgi:N-acyl-L-homoserine lactone synthetase